MSASVLQGRALPRRVPEGPSWPKPTAHSPSQTGAMPSRRLPYFYDLAACSQRREELRKHAVEGGEQRGVAAVAEADLDERWTAGAGQMEEIFILTDNRVSVGRGKLPEVAIGAFRQPDIGDVSRFKCVRPQ